MSKHSPAPWKRSRLDPRCIGFTDDRIEPGFQSNFHAVAQVRERTGETEGNIALIETAPELLEELKQFVYAYTNNYINDEFLKSFAKHAHALVAKAEGRS